MMARRTKRQDRARAAGAEVIVHPQNRGKGESIKTGLRHWLERGFTYVVILDGDGQHLAGRKSIVLSRGVFRHVADCSSALG